MDGASNLVISAANVLTGLLGEGLLRVRGDLLLHLLTETLASSHRLAKSMVSEDVSEGHMWEVCGYVVLEKKTEDRTQDQTS